MRGGVALETAWEIYSLTQCRSCRQKNGLVGVLAHGADGHGVDAVAVSIAVAAVALATAVPRSKQVDRALACAWVSHG